MQFPDCQQCGACCSFGEQWIEVTQADYERLPHSLFVEPAIEEGDWPGELPPYTMRTRNDRCVALQGDIGRSCTCLIYERRPEICRRFERGSPECAYLLGHHGLGRPW